MTSQPEPPIEPREQPLAELLAESALGAGDGAPLSAEQAALRDGLPDDLAAELQLAQAYARQIADAAPAITDASRAAISVMARIHAGEGLDAADSERDAAIADQLEREPHPNETDSVRRLRAVGERVAAASQELTDALADAPLEAHLPEAERAGELAPVSPEIAALVEAHYAGELTPDLRVEIANTPGAREAINALAPAARALTSACGELREQVDPNRAVADWVATSRKSSTSARSSASRPALLSATSTRRSPAAMRIPRRYAGMAAAVLVAATLALTVLWTYPLMQEKARVKTARGQVTTLQMALSAYYDDFDRYPPSGDDNLVRYLDGDPSNGGPPTRYFSFRESKVSENLEFLDPWGRPYRYRSGKDAQHGPFDLWSDGRPTDAASEEPSEPIASWQMNLPFPK